MTEWYDAVGRGADGAIEHLLAALFHGWSGYAPSTVEDFIGSRPKRLAQAGRTIGRILSYNNATTAQVNLGVEVWQRAIDNKRDPEGLKGIRLARGREIDRRH